jgi:hypothetical protein
MSKRWILSLLIGVLMLSLVMPVAAQTDQFQIAYGETISDGVPGPGAGNLETGGAQDAYTFQGTAGDDVIFDSLAGGSGQFFWLLNAPDGAVLFDTFNADRRIILPQSGTYTLTVRGSNANTTGTYSLRIMLVPSPQHFNISVGDTVSEGVPAPGAGHIETPGAVDLYSFNGIAGQGVIFDALIGNTGQFRVILFAPDGAQLFNGFYMDYQVVLTQTGIHSLRVEGLNLDSVGGYSFQLLPMSVTQEFAISIGDTVSDGVPAPGAGNLEAPGAIDTYRFSGIAGQTIIFDALAGNTGQFWVMLTAPDGATVFDSFFVDVQTTLTQTGTYSLTVRGGQVTSSGTYSFQLLNVPPAAQEFAISIGDTVSDGVPAPGAGNLEVPGAVDIYRFEGVASQGVIFDALAGNTGLFRVILAAPDGTQVFNDFFIDQQVTLPQTGTYSLTVQGLNVTSFGSYSFALLAAVTNSNPVANDDVATTDQNVSITIDVLANDTDADGDALIITGVSQPANGTVVNNGTDVTYTPDANFAGTDSFTYTISDGQGGTATATVTVTVNPVNTAPVLEISVDSIETDEGQLITRTLSVSDADGDPLTVQTTLGDLHDLGDGNFQWSYPADDGPALSTVTITADDGRGGLVSASFDLIVHNVPPTASFTNATGPIAAPGMATLTFSSQQDPSQADTNAGFRYSYDCTNAGVFTLLQSTSPSFDCAYATPGAYTARGRIEDKDGGHTDLFAEVMVTSANRPPQVHDDVADTTENTPATIYVLNNDIDPDGDPLTITSVAQPNNGTVVNNGDSVIYTPLAGFTGTDSFTYTASDPFGGSDTALVTVMVDPVTSPEEHTIIVQVNHRFDDVNEQGYLLITRSAVLWISNNPWAHPDFLGLRFNGVNIPPGAIIEEAYLEVYLPLGGWFNFDVEFAADAVGNSPAFDHSNRPSQRTLTNTRITVTHRTSALRPAHTWRRFGDIEPVIQEIIERDDWQNGNSLSLIVRGAGHRWGSVIFTSYDASPAFAPRLVVRYTQN